MKLARTLLFIGIFIIIFGTIFENPTTLEGSNLALTISLVGVALAGIGLILSAFIHFILEK